MDQKLWRPHSLSPQLTSARATTLFENTMENPFFYFFKYWLKHSKNKFRIEIWTFSFQIWFWNQLLTSGSGQTENTQIFSVWPLPKVEHLFRKQIWNENVLIFILNFFWHTFKILLRFGLPNNQILLHLGVPDNQILIHFGVPDNKILLHLDVPDDCFGLLLRGEAKQELGKRFHSSNWGTLGLPPQNEEHCFTVHCTQKSVQCAVYTVYCKLYTVHCTVYRQRITTSPRKKTHC